MRDLEKRPSLSQESQPDLVESFSVEFGNTRFEEIRDKLSELGFSFESKTVSDEEDVVTFSGSSVIGDGTQIEIAIRKGENYKSPRERGEKWGSGDRQTSDMLEEEQ